MDAWRLIRSAPAGGFTNMAVDEAILLAHAAGRVPPTLRLYAWRPPAISTGYFQQVARDIALDACARAGIQVVRRLTGGRAVLHDDEVTYSVVVGSVAGMGVWEYGGMGVWEYGSMGGGAVSHTPTLPYLHTPTLASYRLLCGGLIAGLARLGLEARLAPGQRAHRGPSGANCFAAAAQCDLVVGDRKICGSAQLRRHGVILQHGALLLSTPDPTPYWREAGAPPCATDLTEALGYRPSWDTVADTLAAGFAEALGVPILPGELTEEERSLAEELRREKYATEGWNLRR